MSQYPPYPQEPYQQGEPQQYQQGQPPQNYGPLPQYPQQPQFYPQQPQKKKHTGRNIFLGCGGAFVAVIVIILIVVVAMNANAPKASGTVINTTATSGAQATTAPTTQATTAPTSAPTQSAGATWKTIQTFTGNGTQKTAIFAVPGDWKIVYTCAGQNIAGTEVDGALIVTVYGSDNSIIDPAAVNATCKMPETSNSTEEHQSGNVYLSINGTGDWMITVQVPQ